jgi:hypothetical protein
MLWCGTFDATDGTIIIDLREPAGREWKKGDYLICKKAGPTFPDGTQIIIGAQFAVGVWAMFTGTAGTEWIILENTDAVSSVNGKTGHVVLDKEDVGLDKVTNDEQATKTEFDTHVADNTKHFTTGEKEKLASALQAIRVDGNNLPSPNGIVDLDEVLLAILEEAAIYWEE